MCGQKHQVSLPFLKTDELYKITLQKSCDEFFFFFVIQGRSHWESQGIWSPHFNFRTKQGAIVSVSNIRDAAFCGGSKIIRTRSFTNSNVYA